MRFSPHMYLGFAIFCIALTLFDLYIAITTSNLNEAYMVAAGLILTLICTHLFFLTQRQQTPQPLQRS
jgi:hypothetical protein